LSRDLVMVSPVDMELTKAERSVGRHTPEQLAGAARLRRRNIYRNCLIENWRCTPCCEPLRTLLKAMQSSGARRRRMNLDALLPARTGIRKGTLSIFRVRKSSPARIIMSKETGVHAQCKHAHLPHPRATICLLSQGVKEALRRAPLASV
jgi:hypothetical protein